MIIIISSSSKLKKEVLISVYSTASFKRLAVDWRW